MKIKIYKNQYGFSTLAKNGDDKLYLSVQFKKGNEPQIESGTIEIKNGFFSNYRNKKDELVVKLIVMEYELQDDYVAEEREAIQNEQSYNVSSDELPF